LNLIALETMPEHVHILFEAVPNINLSTFVNAFKTASSRMVRKNFAEELAHYYWKPYFWSLSYFIGSVSDRSTEVVKRYIEDQKDQ
ncbi:MAG: IS200/IS605 family transposase, partial [Eubacteriaceae bacterium]|nr:IS200/IS605 family transposase [Eubacteriaceae bacterium]